MCRKNEEVSSVTRLEERGKVQWVDSCETDPGPGARRGAPACVAAAGQSALRCTLGPIPTHPPPPLPPRLRLHRLANPDPAGATGGRALHHHGKERERERATGDVLMRMGGARRSKKKDATRGATVRGREGTKEGRRLGQTRHAGVLLPLPPRVILPRKAAARTRAVAVRMLQAEGQPGERVCGCSSCPSRQAAAQS